MKKFVLWVIFVLILYAFFELLSLSAYLIFKEMRHLNISHIRKTSLSREHEKIIKTLVTDPTTFLIFSPTLGWTHRPGATSRERGDRVNSAGIRGDREYAAHPATNIIRVTCFGDSFTYCNGVRNPDTWEEYLNRSNPRLEVINFGVGGFGLDQAYLRYLNEGAAYHAQIVLIGYMSENLNRDVNVFRPFYVPGTRTPLVKPRFKLENDRLVLLQNPFQELSRYNELLAHPEVALPQLGANDFYYRTRHEYGFLEYLPSVHLLRALGNASAGGEEEMAGEDVYDVNAESFKVTARIFDEFYAKAIADRSLPVIVVFPCRSDLIDHRQNKARRYAPLLKDFQRKGYRYVDLLDAFDRYGKNQRIEELFGGHYRPKTNEFVAKFLADYLRSEPTIRQLFANIETKATGSP